MIVEWPTLIQTQSARLEQLRVREEKRAKAVEQMRNLFAEAGADPQLQRARAEESAPPPDSCGHCSRWLIVWNCQTR